MHKYTSLPWTGIEYVTSDRSKLVFRDICGRRDSSLDIVTGLRGGQLRNRGSIPGKDKGLLCSPELSGRLCGPRCLLYRWAPRVKRPGCENCHMPPFSAEAENEWSYTFCPPYALMACAGMDLLYPHLLMRSDIGCHTASFLHKLASTPTLY